MSATAERANELADKIQDGEIEPEEISLDPFIEDDLTAMTPALWELLTPEQQEKYNKRRQQKDRETLAERRDELTQDQQHKLDLIQQAVEEETGPGVTTIDFYGEPVEVRTQFPGAVERKIAELGEVDDDDIEDAESLDRVVELAIDVATAMLVDEDWADPAVWHALHESKGIEGLLAAVWQFVEPAVEHQEAQVESFRDRRGATRREDV